MKLIASLVFMLMSLSVEASLLVCKGRDSTGQWKSDLTYTLTIKNSSLGLVGSVVPSIGYTGYQCAPRQSGVRCLAHKTNNYDSYIQLWEASPGVLSGFLGFEGPYGEEPAFTISFSSCATQ